MPADIQGYNFCARGGSGSSLSVPSSSAYVVSESMPMRQCVSQQTKKFNASITRATTRCRCQCSVLAVRRRPRLLASSSSSSHRLHIVADGNTRQLCTKPLRPLLSNPIVSAVCAARSFVCVAPIGQHPKRSSRSIAHSARRFRTTCRRLTKRNKQSYSTHTVVCVP